MNTHRTTLVLSLLCAPLVAADPSLDDIPARMTEFVEKGRISGAVTLVGHHGKIVHHAAVGAADVAAGKPMEKDSLFFIASMTKPVTATALMILVDEGKLSLDDPVAKHLPEFAKSKLKGEPPAKPITIRHLLTHTSGVGGDQRNRGTLAESVAALAEQPLQFEAGSKWQYSPGLTVCGRIIEVASGKSYPEFLQERILEPLGMSDTTFFPTADQRKRIVQLYQPGKEVGSIAPAEHWLTQQSGERTANPSGGLVSSAADLFRFYQMVLNGGELDGKRVLSEKAVKEMTTIQTGDLVTGFTPGNGWGLGWCVVREPQGVTAMLSPGTFGHGGAFGTQGWVDPKTNTIYVLLIQRTNFGNADGSPIRAAFQQATVDALNPE